MPRSSLIRMKEGRDLEQEMREQAHYKHPTRCSTMKFKQPNQEILEFKTKKEEKLRMRRGTFRDPTFFSKLKNIRKSIVHDPSIKKDILS